MSIQSDFEEETKEQHAIIGLTEEVLSLFEGKPTNVVISAAISTMMTVLLGQDEEDSAKLRLVLMEMATGDIINNPSMSITQTSLN